LALEAPRDSVVMTTPCSPTNRRASHAGTRRGGLARSQRQGPEPLGHRRRLVVDDVVDAHPVALALDGRSRCGGRVVDVDERRHPRALAADGEPAAPDALELDAALAERGARAVEGPVPLDDALDALGPEDGSLQVSHGLQVRRKAAGDPGRRVLIGLDRPAGSGVEARPA